MSLFDTTNATSTGIMDGDYTAVIIGAEVKTAKSGGRYINVKWQIDSGMSFYHMYTIENASDVARNIGLADLGKIQIASGGIKGPVNSTEELIGLRCVVSVVNKTDSYGDKIVIKKYSKAAEASPF